jgi:hypothetical protein
LPTSTGGVIRSAAAALLLIERGRPARDSQHGALALKTLNFYVPPAYTKEGDERPAAKPGEGE